MYTFNDAVNIIAQRISSPGSLPLMRGDQISVISVTEGALNSDWLVVTGWLSRPSVPGAYHSTEPGLIRFQVHRSWLRSSTWAFSPLHGPGP